MGTYKIITDTSCNLPAKLLDAADVQMVPFSFYPRDNENMQMHCTDIANFDGKAYYDDIRKGNLYNTSQISPQACVDVIAPFAAQGMDVLYISMSSGISGAYNSSLTAKRMLEEEYPDCQFVMFDTRAASLGEGIAVLRAIEYRDSGMSLADTCRALEEVRDRTYQVFTVDSLRHLQRTGRLSGAARVIGTLLNIKPILRSDENGQIITADKVRGTERALRALAERYDTLVVHPEEQIVGIAHADNLADVERLREMICANRPPKEVMTVCYEPVTGAHVGPGTVALFFLGDTDVRFH